MNEEESKFWLVWRERSSSQSGELSSYLPQYKHDTEESARTEAERLARKYGGRFHVLELTATVERDDMKWSDREKSAILGIRIGSMTMAPSCDCPTCSLKAAARSGNESAREELRKQGIPG